MHHRRWQWWRRMWRLGALGGACAAAPAIVLGQGAASWREAGIIEL